MNISLLLEMSADVLADRVAVVAGDDRLTYAELQAAAGAAAARVAAAGVDDLALVDENSTAVPVALFGAALAGKPFAPVNYRLATSRLRELVERLAPTLVVAGEAAARVEGLEGVSVLPPHELATPAAGDGPAPVPGGPDDPAVLLFTSGTTGQPKAAVLRHQHLTSYILSSLEPFSAGEEEATLVSVPPYHVAGVAAILSSVYVGRRIAYLQQFTPEAWIALARTEAVTHAMVVPTMLRRILDVLEQEGTGLPYLRHLSYGGGRMPLQVVEQALRVLPDVDLVNAYGLTETSSTIAVLGPEDHRAAFSSDDPNVRRRLTSVGKPLPTLEVVIRDEAGVEVGPGGSGEIWVRGEQIAGEYLGLGSKLVDGWFPTRDAGFLDEDGYLFVEGRMDDVIVRGGENMSPGEIEEVLVAHPAVEEVAVIGVPDVEWGEAVVAAVVVAQGTDPSDDELADWVRSRLRSSRTPQRFVRYDELPYNETGKLLRRVLRDELAVPVAPAAEG